MVYCCLTSFLIMRCHSIAIPQYVDSFEVQTESDAVYYLVQRLAEGETMPHLSFTPPLVVVIDL